MVTAHTFLSLLSTIKLQVIGGSSGGARYSGRGEHERAFRSLFGVGASVVADLWCRCESERLFQRGTRPKHLLWALLMMKVYPSESVIAGMVSATRKCMRKWVWPCIQAISDLFPLLVSDRLVFLCCSTVLLSFAQTSYTSDSF